jgi:hypothetical protein
VKKDEQKFRETERQAERRVRDSLAGKGDEEV